MSLLLIGLYRFSVRLAPWLVGMLLVVDVLLLNSIIAIYGAASNPFNAILLLPVVMAFTILPLVYAGLVLIISIAAQSMQLLLLPTDYHEPAMQGHYFAMVVSFIITSGLLALVISYFRYQIMQREQAIHKLRERQLRDEQLLAIGTAAAQLTHEVATPAQSLRLLLEEAHEQQPNPVWLAPIMTQFSRIEEHLQNWRRIADDVREQRFSAYCVRDIWQTLRYTISLTRPEAKVVWEQQGTDMDKNIEADATLVPALSSIITNGCDAASVEGTPVSVALTSTESLLILTVTNPKVALDDAKLARLGTQVSASDNGFGVGAVVSNATIEKFGGNVLWKIQKQQLITRVALPLMKAKE